MSGWRRGECTRAADGAVAAGADAAVEAGRLFAAAAAACFRLACNSASERGDASGRLPHMRMPPAAASSVGLLNAIARGAPASCALEKLDDEFADLTVEEPAWITFVFNHLVVKK